jgi:hypothetical protein
MVFEKGNKLGRKKTIIPHDTKLEILYAIDQFNIGYSYIKNVFGYSYSTCRNNGIKTHNDPVIEKQNGKYVSLTKIAEKQLNRI